ncbi:cupin domain-containing protein [Thermodesulfobacteriota bacterium]
MVESIKYKDNLLAIIISHKFNEPGIHFFTPDDLSQQLAFMRHPVGKVIFPHVHNPIPRKVHYTQEVLFIREGKLRIDFYNDEKEYLESRILQEGDVTLLVSGGHGFEVLEDLEMIEVKQGPYVGDHDKTRFDPIAVEKINLKKN